ncbi:MAG: lysylphosphatidylglycerol synthase domain-containing protein [Anaerolineae bacterium]|nr:flippase-like domain-containing protein [Anaerolineae bacterium]MDW8100155.1 lysylphosphatidylglycerol synthase domain-containing protein [Anaerolineae bacterium]
MDDRPWATNGRRRARGESDRRGFRWRNLVSALALLLGMGFIAALLHGQWSALQAYSWRLSPGWFLLGFPPLALSWALEIALWRTCLCNLGGRLTYRQAGMIWFLSNLVRYIPGNVWQFVGMAALAGEEDVPAEATLTSVVVHQALSATSVVTLAAVYFAWAGHIEMLRLTIPLAVMVGALLVAIRPRWMERGLNLVLRLLRRPPLRVTLTTRQIIQMLPGYWASWALAGLGFAAVVRALTPLSWVLTPHLAMAFVLAYFIGYISLLTPSGLGVREGAMMWLLSGFLTAPIPVVASLVGRIWLTMGEVMGAGMALLLWHRRRSTRSRRELVGASAVVEAAPDG